jgi:ribulose kinase
VLWVARHEPEVFAKVAKVLLPKDYVRLKLTGDHASDMSDSAGTSWLDTAKRDWSDELLAATNLTRDADAESVRGLRGDRHAARRSWRSAGAWPRRRWWPAAAATTPPPPAASAW